MPLPAQAALPCAARRRLVALAALSCCALPLRLAAADTLPPAPPPAQAPAPSVASSGLVPRATLIYRTTGTFRFAGLPLTMHARTTTTWQLADGRYESHLHTETIDFDQRSEGGVDSDGALMPERYTEKRPFHNPEAVSVDWPKQTITFGTAPPAPAPERGAQDRLSLQFELARRCGQRPGDFAPGSTHAIHLIGPHDVDPWTFVVADDQAVDTGLGRTRAVRFSARRKVRDVTETMDVWLGADLHWMPVRIRMVDRNGAVIDSILQSAEFP